MTTFGAARSPDFSVVIGIHDDADTEGKALERVVLDVETHIVVFADKKNTVLVDILKLIIQYNYKTNSF